VSTVRHPKISVIGLGKLGCCLAAVLAYKGFEVIGVEIDGAKVKAINAGVSPIREPGIQELLDAGKLRFSATTDVESAITETDFTFVVVPTPSEDSGVFSLHYVARAFEGIARALRQKVGYHLVTLTSTVMPGSMDNLLAPLLEKISGRRLGRKLGLCYSPELIALGDVIRGLTEPEIIIIGASDQRAGAALADLKRQMCNNSPIIAHMNFVNAELTKIALNSFVTMKMSFANTLAEICEKLPGADVDVVAEAIGRDRRVGRSNLKGALGYGGPCFPRDNVAFVEFAKRAGVNAELALATHNINNRQLLRIVRLVESECRPEATIAVLGLAYKPKTNIVESSQSFALVSKFLERGHRVNAYDPEVTEDDVLQLVQLGANVVRDIGECLSDADACVVATPWSAFTSIEPELLKGKTVIDCWRILPAQVSSVARYIPIGRFTAKGERILSSISIKGSRPMT